MGERCTPASLCAVNTAYLEGTEEGDAAIAILRKIVRVMKACDPEYCAAHDWKPADDAEWDEVLEEAEDYLEGMK